MSLPISHRSSSKKKPKGKAKKKSKKGKTYGKDKNSGSSKYNSNASKKKSASKSQKKSFYGKSKNKQTKANDLPKLRLDIDQETLRCTQTKIKDWQNPNNLTPPTSAAKNLLDPWQTRVLEALRGDRSIVVDAPTSAGKTRAVEFFFQENLKNPNFRAAYTTPVKSLSNDKLKEFREKFGEENVGIATGDVKENLDAPIVIATLECYRNSLLGIDPDLGRNIVIFDEYHYIQDETRGSAWEEAIILTPKSCQLLLLSASVKNGLDFTEWVTFLRDEQCEFIQTQHRPVPLKDLIYHNGHWIAADCLPPKTLSNILKSKKSRGTPDSPDPLKMAKSLEQVVQLNLSPTIIYCGRRIACELTAKIIKENTSSLNVEEKQEIADILHEWNEKYNSLDLMPSVLKNYIMNHGVAYHHSGLAPVCRLAIEALLKKSKLRFCTATMGLSLGINFGVRSALIADYQRPGSGGMSTYLPSEVLQMLGRAGRRGNDIVGFSLWPDLDMYSRMANAQREECHSRLKTDPITFLGLTDKGFSLQEIEGFYKKSFHYYFSDVHHPTVIDKDKVSSRLRSKLPCTSPVFSFANYLNEDKSLCNKCSLRSGCHSYMEKLCQNNLSYLQLHLGRLKTIDENDKLTKYGNIAKHFPQNGGLLIAKLLYENKITAENMLTHMQLFAALCMAKHKEILVPDSYKFPFDSRQIVATLENFYPEDLFPELYDPPWGSRRYSVLRDFNVGAGYIISEWMRGVPWETLSAQVCSDNFGSGDMSGLMFRIGTYLISISSSADKDLAEICRQLREELLRPPLYLTI